MDDVTFSRVTCFKCGISEENDNPEIKGPMEFVAAQLKNGWTFSHHVLCPNCR